MISFSDKTQNRINQLIGFIQAPEIKVVSFDIFDTLLCRPVMKPIDLFDLVEAIIKDRHNRPFLLFSKMRRKAEQEARQNTREDEVTLAEIYDHMQQLCQLNSEFLNTLMECELEVERDMLRPRRVGKLLFDAAVAAGKTVIIQSDMYLPESFVAEQLQRCGYGDYDKLYLSSSLKLTKHSGRLYRHVMADLERPAQEFVHFGDNKRTDIDQAKANGLAAFHLPKAVDVFLDHQGNGAVWRQHLHELELGVRLQLGLIINQVFDVNIFDNRKRQSSFAGDPYILGYYGVGLWVLAMTKWIVQQAERDGFEEIHFIARDGKLPLQAFEKLAPLNNSSLRGNYLMASRSLCYPLQMNAPEDVAFNAERLYVHAQTSVRDLLVKRLGLQITDEITAVLTKKGYEDLDQPPKNIEQFFVDCRSFYQNAIDSLTSRRDRTLAYYRSQIPDPSKAVLFDIGYRARVQRLLAGHWQEPVHAYYLMSFSDMTTTYFSNATTRNYLFPPQARGWITPHYYTAILELLISDVERGSVMDVKTGKDGEFTFEFEENYINPESLEIVRSLQQGCLDFLDAYVELFAKYDRYLNVLPKTSLRILEHYMQCPTALDAQILSNIAFSNGIIGDTFAFIQPDGKRSYWKPGADALASKAPPPPEAPVSFGLRLRRAVVWRVRKLIN